MEKYLSKKNYWMIRHRLMCTHQRESILKTNALIQLELFHTPYGIVSEFTPFRLVPHRLSSCIDTRRRLRDCNLCNGQNISFHKVCWDPQNDEILYSFLLWVEVLMLLNYLNQEKEINFCIWFAICKCILRELSGLCLISECNLTREW